MVDVHPFPNPLRMHLGISRNISGNIRAAVISRGGAIRSRLPVFLDLNVLNISLILTA